MSTTPAARHPGRVVKRPVQEGGAYLTEAERSRMKDLWVSAKKVKSEKRRDAQPTIELMYLGLLGRVKNRDAVEKELKELKKMLDASAALMIEILEKSEKQTTSK
ncbi:MAG: hypothetical protein ABSF83_04750 [Nitrososphaerales archaeon]|jgi:hypothetical protein